MNAEERVEQLRSLLRDDPEDGDLYFLLGKALLDSGSPNEAAETLAEAAARNPDHAAICRFWGEALRDAQRTEEALRAWGDGIEIAERTGDLQAGKEMAALVKKLKKGDRS